MRLEGVGRRYGAGPWVLRGIDLEVRAHGLLRVEGPNGSGKSTLLRMLAGIEAPSAGRVTGRPPARGYVPERFPPALPLTALGYLTHLGRVRGLRTRAAARDGLAWLERLGAGEFADQRLRELSKGSSQKVAVAQALLGRPGLLVLDEAWTGLDGPARAELEGAVRERVEEGAAVVYVDHDPRRLADAGPAVCRIAHGGLVDTGLVDAGLADVGPADVGPRGGAWTRIEAVGPAGAPLPTALPGGVLCVRAQHGAVALTLPTTDSDATLRALLAADPAWHVRAVHEYADREYAVHAHAAREHDVHEDTSREHAAREHGETA